MPTKIKRTQPETPNEVQFRDQFQTPRYAVELLIPWIPKEINIIWEPTVGEGRIAKVLRYFGYSVLGTDIAHYEYPADIVNFLECATIVKDPTVHPAIITNPPYSLKKKFYEKCLEFEVPFALLIPCDYCQWIIEAIWYQDCEKIIPTRRINYITPETMNRVNKGENTDYKTIYEVPNELIAKYSKSQFHSMWLTHGFGLDKTETFVDLPLEQLVNI